MSMISKENVKDIIDLTTVQKGMLFHYLKDEENYSYNTQIHLKITGSLSIELLEEALIKTQQDNDVLRSVFRWKNINNPLQIILKSSKLEFDSSIANELPFATIKERHWKRRFDLEKTPFRIAIIKNKEGEFYDVLVTHHHIIYDGWSTGVFFKEWFKNYNILLNENDLKPSNKIDYSSAINLFKNNFDALNSELFWEKYLVDFEVKDVLHTANTSKVTVQKEYFNKLKFTQSIDSITKFSVENNVTKAAVIYGVLGVLFNKCFDLSDFCIGTTVSTRSMIGSSLDNTMGVFINTLPLRFQNINELTFKNLVSNIHNHLIERESHKNIAYGDVKEILDLNPDQELFNIVAVIENYPLDSEILEINKTTKISVEGVHENIDTPLLLTIFCDAFFEIDITFNPTVLDQFMIENLFKSIQIVLDKCFQQPEDQIANYGIASKEYLDDINLSNSLRVKHDHNSIVELIENQALTTPDKVAVSFKTTKVTYKELNERANQVGYTLLQKGVSQGDLIGVLVDRNEELFILILGIWKIRCAFLPIVSHHPIDRNKYVIENSRIKHVITNLSIKDSYRDLHINFITLEECQPLFKEKSISNHKIKLSSEDRAYVIYTSGSTGKPKGCAVSHKNLYNLYLGYKKGLIYSPTDNVLCITTFTFDIFMVESFVPLAFGLQVVLVGDEDQKKPALIADLIEKEEVTFIQCTPSHFRVLFESSKFLTGLKGVSTLFLGGENFPIDMLGKLKEHYSGKIYNGYGPTETTVWSTMKEITNEDSVSIGRPIINTEVYLLDSLGNQVPFSFPGELCIGGEGVSLGYIHNEKLNKERFIKLEGKSNPIYKTGDLVKYVEGGDLQFISRKDHQIKIRGFRVELGEIEQTILNCHEDVLQAKAILEETTENQIIVAYIRAKSTVDTEVLKEELSSWLPDYMVPSQFFQLKEFPLSPNGKLDTKRLPRVIDYIKSIKLKEKPENELQSKLQFIWSKVLGVDQNQIGVSDNFFQIGGNSLKAMQLQNSIRKLLGKEVVLSEILSGPTIKKLSKLIEASKEVEFNKIKYSGIKDYYPLSAEQTRLYLLQRIQEKSTAYNMVYLAEISGEINTDKVAATLQTLVDKHAILRTYFEFKEGKPIQKIHDNLTIDIAFFKGESIDSSLSKFVRPFNLEKAPLIRAGIQEHNGVNHLLIDLHHIICDGVSVRILMDQFSNLYNGIAIDVPKIRYVDYVAWFDKELATLKKQSKEFWIDQLGEQSMTKDLPLDYKRVLTKSDEGAVVTNFLDENYFTSLQELSTKNGTTPYVTTFAILSLLLHEVYDHDTVNIGTTMGGRRHADLENMVGMFVNTMVVNSEKNDTGSFQDLLVSFKDKITSCIEHQYYSYEELMYDLQINRDNGRNPLFDVMYTYQNFEHSSLKLNGVALKEKEFHKKSKFDLTFRVTEESNKLKIEIEFSTALFKVDTVEKISKNFVKGIQSILKKPSTELKKINFHSVDENNEAFRRNDKIGITYPQDETIISVFEKQVQRYPNKFAVKCNDDRVTYQELFEKVINVAAYLQHNGVGKNDYVALYADRSIETIVGILAILKCGAAYVPIDPKHPIKRINSILSDSQTSFILTKKQYSGLSHDIEDKALFFFEDINQLNYQFKEVTFDPQTISYVIYTSGTTGKPKGVMIEHRNVIRLLFNDNPVETFDENDIWTLFHSPCFDFSVWEIFGAILHGGSLIIVPEETTKDLIQFLSLLAEEKVTILNQTPSAFYGLSQFIDEDTKHSIRKVIFGGEALNFEKLKTWKEQFPKTKLVNMYGITEITVHATHKEIKEKDIHEGKSNIGTSIPTLALYILDENLQRKQVGVAGEIYVSGAGVARGYLNNEKLTRERFMQDPFRPEHRMYKTGDLGKMLPNGDIEYLGRIDRQIQLRGFRIELSEIETKLLGHDQIDDVAVTTKMVSGSKVICAYYLSNKEFKSSELRMYLLNVLPDYMVPSFFVKIESLPLTINGKLDESKLPEPVFGKKNKKTPKNEIQKKLVKIWAEILGVSEDKIGVNTSFFEIGGDSLKVIQISEKINQEFNVNIPVTKIFSHPFIIDLANFLSEEKLVKSTEDSEEEQKEEKERVNNVIRLLRQN